MCWGVVLGPLFEDESVDSRTVYAGRTWDQGMINALFSVVIRLATSR
jgi:hypothetical protein